MILTIDEGTTSTRALVIDNQGKILGIKQKEITQFFPQPGWVEHDPIEIWQASLESCRTLLKDLLSSKTITSSDIEGISITNQRETTIIWDSKNSKPIYNAIVWQCKRTKLICKELKKNLGLQALINAQTGLLIDSYFSGTKIKWLQENIIEKNSELKNQELYFGTIDTWLIWNLTKGKKHLTDTTNASRTLVFDIYKKNWSEEIINALEIKNIKFPQVLDSRSNYGTTDYFSDLLGREIPILSVIGDQQSALHAYNNESKITFGTGSFVLIPLKAACSFPGLLTSVSYSQSQQIHYALEASIFTGGSIVQWLRDGLGIINHSSEIESLAMSVTDNGGVYLIPALTGLGAPHWLEDVQGAIFGITRGTQKNHIARAGLEAIAYQVADVLKILDLSSIDFINVDGGASRNNFLMQFLADLITKPLKRYTETEMTALGSAKMTGLVELNLKADAIFEPKNNLDDTYKQWQLYLSKITNQHP
jgi:glycerol kinase